jgi:hypothetical protein
MKAKEAFPYGFIPKCHASMGLFSPPKSIESPICHDTISIFKFYSDWDFILVNALSETSFQVNSSLKMLSMVHCKKKIK